MRMTWSEEKTFSSVVLITSQEEICWKAVIWYGGDEAWCLMKPQGYIPTTYGHVMIHGPRQTSWRRIYGTPCIHTPHVQG